ncbi:hypothetical protein PLICRDRAFT_573932 [Plicaturopsis crispa FD-325 SS-3]|nr:hypothetical protein PLICRDRAFT_573932 [Plicaturopsis crispa FD-325 SS-3]
MFEERVWDVPESSTPPRLFTFIDDGKISTSSKSLDTNVVVLREAYDLAVGWLKDVGLSPDLVKRELGHYTRRRKDGNPHIMLPGKNGDDVAVTAGPVKWLGVLFDRKLTFDGHVKMMAGRAENAVNALCMLANTCRCFRTHVQRGGKRRRNTSRSSNESKTEDYG